MREIKGSKFTHTHTYTLQSHTLDGDFIMNSSIFLHWMNLIIEFLLVLHRQAFSAWKCAFREKKVLILSHSHQASLSLTHSVILAYHRTWKSKFISMCILCEERGRKKIVKSSTSIRCVWFMASIYVCRFYSKDHWWPGD